MTDSLISTIPAGDLTEFCRRWKILELALFGSALREDSRPDSDLDLMATFAADADWSLLDHVQMELELERLIHRSVDLISRRALEQSQDWLLREEIFKTARVLFQSREVARAAR